MKHFWTFWRLVGIIAWVAASAFIIPGLILWLLFKILLAQGVELGGLLESAAGVMGLYGLQFVLGFAVLMIIPIFFEKLRSVEISKLIGISRGIKPIDIGYGLLAFGAYMVMSVALQILAVQFMPGYDPNEVQQLGFSTDIVGWDLLLAGIGLVVLAPVFEELLFRGYMFGKIRRLVPFWLTALLVSVLFGVAHGQVNVALDVFVLSMCMSVVREKTDSIWGTIMMHMIKNGLAFTLLFIVKLDVETLSFIGYLK